ncbi:histone-like nucleoid-structuring protein Lsr2 [Streptomyces roseochromogenus]|uniref:histone-like nucleoid-structuring protein Lsr2 n=1 Tax=Streptomyces roseochromogenus TaxID=285450 RepID=UPI003CC9125E
MSPSRNGRRDMARHVETYFVDDLTQERGDDVQTRSFELDGVSYEIDLSAASYETLESTLSPFVKAARRTSSGRRTRSRKAPTRKRVPAATFSDAEPDPAEIRKWAKERKIAVPARGRIPRSVREQFVAVHTAA